MSASSLRPIGLGDLIRDTRVTPANRRIGYEFLRWFKSLAALGSPAPRVLAPLRAARRTGTTTEPTAERAATTRLKGSARRRPASRALTSLRDGPRPPLTPLTTEQRVLVIGPAPHRALGRIRGRTVPLSPQSSTDNQTQSTRKAGVVDLDRRAGKASVGCGFESHAAHQLSVNGQVEAPSTRRSSRLARHWQGRDHRQAGLIWRLPAVRVKPGQRRWTLTPCGVLAGVPDGDPRRWFRRWRACPCPARATPGCEPAGTAVRAGMVAGRLPTDLPSNVWGGLSALQSYPPHLVGPADPLDYHQCFLTRLSQTAAPRH